MLRMLPMLCYGQPMPKTVTRQSIVPVAPRAVDRSDPRVAAYPTLRQAAAMLGVTVSSLSRRRDLPAEPFGRERRLRPSTVMELAGYYRRRNEYEVAGSLLDYALKHAPSYAEEIERELDEYLQATDDRDAPLAADAFLASARRHLPADLYEQVAAAYTGSSH
jgi:hypothetical protein